MKALIRATFFNAISLYAINQIWPKVSYNSFWTLLITALVLALMNAIVLPFLKLLVLPFNVITFGLIGWVVHVLILYLVDFVVTGFSIGTITLTVGSTSLILTKFWAYLAVAMILNILTTFIAWILR